MTGRPLPALALATALGLPALLLPAPALAQTAPTPAPAPAPAAAPAAAQSGNRTSGTFRDFGYGETALRGTYGTAELFFPLPVGSRPEGESVVELDLTHSPLLLPRSTLTVLAGGVAVASTRLVPDGAGGSTLTARVPASLVGPAGLALSVRTFLRLTDDECEETTNPALWATVRPTSTVRLGTTPAARDLRDTAGLLVGRDGRTPVQVRMDGDDAQVLRAGGYVAAQAGRWQGARGADAVVRATTDDLSDVLVAAGPQVPAAFPVTWQGSGFAAGTTQVAGDEGVLALTTGGPARLLVSGAAPEDVVSAARALTRPATEAVLGGPYAGLTGEEPQDLPRASLPWRDGAASFAQLGIGKQDVVGAGARELRLTIDRPPSWTIRDQARLDLVVDAGAALSATSSTVQATLAGTELGSRRLEPGQGPELYAFDVPPGLVDRRLDGRPVRSMELVLRFVLDVEERACDAVDPSAVRASVLPTSALRLPHDTYDGRELGRFPHPLRGSDGGGRVAVVLPEDPDPVTLSAGLQTAAALGRWSPADAPPPELVTADATGEIRPGTGLVLLGEAARQLGSEVDLGRPAVAARAGQATAVLGLVDSPLDEDATALVVQGEPSGLLLAATALGSRDGVSLLRGSRVALSGARPAESLAGASGVAPPPELTPVEGGRFYEEVRSYTVPAVLIGVGLLVALALVVRYRWRPQARRAT